MNSRDVIVLKKIIQYSDEISAYKWKCCSYAIAAEQKARTTYDNILRLVDDPDIKDPIKFLREREIVHFQRFGEAILTNLRRFFPYQKCLDCSVQAQ